VFVVFCRTLLHDPNLTNIVLVLPSNHELKTFKNP